MGSVQKICCACSADVANKKRVKDTQGNYYCQPCYEAKKTDNRVGAAATAARAGEQASVATTAVADPYDFPPAETGDIGLAEEAKPIAEAMSPDMFGCADCKKLVASKQIRNDDGDFVCHVCFSKRQARRPPPTAARKSFAEEEGISREPGFKDTLLGGTLIAAGIVVLAFAIFLTLKLTGVEKNSGVMILNIITSGVEAFFIVIAAGSLIASMFIAARILGGCDFGTLGGALWKSTAIMLGFFLVNSYLNQLAGGIMIGLGFRGCLLVLTFILVFKLEYFEAALLTVINFFILLFLIVLMAILLTSLHRAMERANYNDDDAPPAVGEPNPGANLKPLAPDPQAGAPANAPAAPAQ